MAITNQNVKIYRGNNAQLKVTLTTSQDTVYAPAVGDLVRYRILRNAHSPEAEALVTKTLGSGLTILDGIATIEITQAETQALEPGLYYHEIKIDDPPLERSTAMTGTVVVKSSFPIT